VKLLNLISPERRRNFVPIRYSQISEARETNELLEKVNTYKSNIRRETQTNVPNSTRYASTADINKGYDKGYSSGQRLSLVFNKSISAFNINNTQSRNIVNRLSMLNTENKVLEVPAKLKEFLGGTYSYRNTMKKQIRINLKNPDGPNRKSESRKIPSFMSLERKVNFKKI
jgi:hypothetical protein